MKSRLVLPATLSILLAGGVVLAAPEAAPAGEPVRERVAVGLINVPVFVEDNRGQAVTDLTEADFVVTEDGQRMAVKHFAWIGAEEAAAAAAESDSPELHLVVFVDSQNIRPTHRQQVVKQLAPLLQSELTADLPLMLASGNPNIEVLKSFSAPRSVLPYRLEELGKSAGGGLFDADTARLQREQISRSVRDIKTCVREPECDLREMEGTAVRAVGEIRAYASGVAQQVRGSLEQFRHFAGSLSSFPGTKSVLYISDGFPMQAGRDLFDELSRAIDDVITKSDPGGQRERSGGLDAGSYDSLRDTVQRAPMDFFSNDIARALEETTAAANASNVRVYTLQASALAGSSAAGSDDQAALRLLANATGGKFLPGGVRAEAMLQRMLGDTQGYYSIAYTPPPSVEREYHEVEVKVKRRRTVARYPQGYLTRSDQTQRIDQVMAALFHGYGDNESAIGLDLGPGGRDASRNPVIHVKVRIPVRELDLAVRGDQHAADLKLIIAVMNASGRTTMLQEFPVAVAIPSQHIQQAREQDYPVTLTVPASTGSNRVAVGIWDPSSAKPDLVHGVYEWAE